MDEDLQSQKKILNCHIEVSIMGFNRTTAYSLSILALMAKDSSRRMSASQIHRDLKIPYSYLRQVMSELSRHGFITGSAGRNGGFLLAKKTSEISIVEIINSGEGLKSLEECIMGYQKCPLENPCPVHSVWTETREEIFKILSKTSLNKMIDKTTTNKKRR